MRPILHKIVTDVDTEKRKRFRKGPIAVLNVGIRRQETTTLRRIFWPSDWMAWEQSQEAIAFRRWSSHGHIFTPCTANSNLLRRGLASVCVITCPCVSLAIPLSYILCSPCIFWHCCKDRQGCKESPLKSI